MLVVFASIFVADTKIIFGYDFAALLTKLNKLNCFIYIAIAKQF